MITCGQCGRESPDDARFCAGCGVPLGAPAAVAPREERKVVTVVFVDLVGSTARAEQLDPEDMRAQLAAYHGRARAELERHGGTVEKFIGDAVVAVFGAPIAHEDDPERAVRAALAVQEAIDELNDDDPGLELEVRIGVNTGEALVTLEARPEADEGMVSGDVINTAARLQSAAPPGGILAGEQTYRATERAIEYSHHAPVEAKGKAAPVAAWLAVAPRARFGVEDVDVGRAPLVGREREVALLADALARVRRDQRPQLITLVGVPGIGKSRLVQELREIVDADPELIAWRRGRSLSYGEGVPYWALGEIVKAHAGILENDGVEAASTKLTAAVSGLRPNHTEASGLGRRQAQRAHALAPPAHRRGHVAPAGSAARPQRAPGRDAGAAARASRGRAAVRGGVRAHARGGRGERRAAGHAPGARRGTHRRPRR
jgi:class 3 adenylate cyclase